MTMLRSLFLSFLLLPLLAFAQQMPTPPALAAKSWLLIESASGQELAAQAADERLEPASLTKLMTAYLTFAALKQGTLKIDLKYGPHNEQVITGIRRVSKPGFRQYKKSDLIPKVMSGLGIGILSTSKGVMTDKQAREQNVGGELLCEVW